MRQQRRVADFCAAHDLDAPPAYRLLDVASEVGEIAKEINESTGYGDDPDAADVAEDEVGDALFALLAASEELGIDAGAALDRALAKYRDRLATTGSAGSGGETGEDGGGDESRPTVHHKLVRDGIPAIIEADGDRPVTRRVEGEAYRDRLAEKLVEEAVEYRESRLESEIADVLAVVDAVRSAEGFGSVEDLRAAKAAERGEFEDGVVLEAVEPGESV